MKFVRVAALVFSLAASGAQGFAAPDGYRVIVHPANPATAIERRMLADFFLKKATAWPNGQRVAPVDLGATSRVRDKFTREILNRTISAVKNYWQQLIFSGRGLPPPEIDSDEAVVHFVLSHPGSIGYVSEHAELGAAKVLVVD